MLRVGRVLLSDARVTKVGIPDRTLGTHPRVAAISDPRNFDVVVSNDMSSTLASRAWEADVPVVLATELEKPARNIIDNANLEGLARCLAHQAMRIAGADRASVAWTTPGKRLSRGPTLLFPQPIGRLRVVEDRDIAVAPTDGPLAGAVASATGSLGTATYGLVESPEFLDATILASVAICAATQCSKPVTEMASEVISEVRYAGLVIASKIA
jgi:hypothetical protein